MLGGINIEDLEENPAGLLVFSFTAINNSRRRPIMISDYLNELHRAFSTMPSRYINALACQTSVDLTTLLANPDMNDPTDTYFEMRESISQRLKSRAHAWTYSSRAKSFADWEEEMISKIKPQLASDLGIVLPQEQHVSAKDSAQSKMGLLS